jgi:hypothetical protein
MSRDEHPREQFPREAIIRPFRNEPFEVGARLCVIARLSERERATFDGIRIRNLRQRNTEREDDGERSGNDSFHGDRFTALERRVFLAPTSALAESCEPRRVAAASILMASFRMRIHLIGSSAAHLAATASSCIAGRAVSPILPRCRSHHIDADSDRAGHFVYSKPFDFLQI